MSRWPSTKAKRILAALLRIGWSVKRHKDDLGSDSPGLFRPGFANRYDEEMGSLEARMASWKLAATTALDQFVVRASRLQWWSDDVSKGHDRTAATECATGASPHPTSTTLRRVLKDAAYRSMDTHPTVGWSFTTRDQTAHV